MYCTIAPPPLQGTLPLTPPFLEPGLQADLPTVCVQPHEVLLLEGDTEEWDLVPGLVRGSVQALGLEHDEQRLHEVLDALLLLFPDPKCFASGSISFYLIKK